MLQNLLPWQQNEQQAQPKHIPRHYLLKLQHRIHSVELQSQKFPKHDYGPHWQHAPQLLQVDYQQKQQDLSVRHSFPPKQYGQYLARHGLTVERFPADCLTLLFDMNVNRLACVLSGCSGKKLTPFPSSMRVNPGDRVTCLVTAGLRVLVGAIICAVYSCINLGDSMALGPTTN